MASIGMRKELGINAAWFSKVVDEVGDRPFGDSSVQYTSNAVGQAGCHLRTPQSVKPPIRNSILDVQHILPPLLSTSALHILP